MEGYFVNTGGSYGEGAAVSRMSYRTAKTQTVSVKDQIAAAGP